MIEQSRYKVSDRWLIYLEADGMYTIHKTTDYTQELAKMLSGEPVNNFGNLYNAICY